LLHSAINGKNAMPPRGTCATCSDDELKAAIEYMVSQSK
jgi:cytochrome c5